MVSELFESVRKAEEKADACMKAAREHAADILKEAESAVSEAKQDALREQRTLYQSLVEEKRANLEKQLAADAEKHTADIEQRMTDARSHIPQAIRVIAERITGNGNC